MSSSSVTLFYGLWVKTWSLTFAADAYDKVCATLLAIDLICARRRRGDLVRAERAEGRTTAVNLLGEVWELVKQQVIDQAVDDVEQDAITRTRCPGCRRHSGEELREEVVQSWTYLLGAYSPPATEWMSWMTAECSWCRDLAYSYGLRDRQDRLKNGKRLLRLFGLSLATKKVHVDSETEHEGIDDRSAIAIPFKPSSPFQNFPAVNVEAVCDDIIGYTNSSACDVSPEAFLLPSDTKLRFRRLVYTYRLLVDDPTGGQIITRPALGTDTAAEGHHDVREMDDSEELYFAVRQPRWILWTHATPGW